MELNYLVDNLKTLIVKYTSENIQIVHCAENCAADDI